MDEKTSWTTEDNPVYIFLVCPTCISSRFKVLDAKAFSCVISGLVQKYPFGSEASPLTTIYLVSILSTVTVSKREDS